MAEAFQERHQRLGAVADAVARDDQQKVARGQAAPHAVDEGDLVGIGEAGTQAAQQVRVLRPRGGGGLLLQHVEGPARQLLGVVEDLPHHLAARLGVAPELAPELGFHQHPARWA